MDFSVTPPQQITREFLAVILAGFGNELVPLTGDLGNQPCPKALLPIFNKPMLDYILSWIEPSGIQEVLLICPSSHRPSVSHFIHSDSSAASSLLRIDLQTFDGSQGLSVGTCSVLRHFSSRIKGDFVLLPCDFIPPPSLPLSKLLNKFRTETMSDGALMTALWNGDRNAQSTPIAWDRSTGTLLHVDTLTSDRNPNELDIRMNLLSRYPRVNLSSGFQDSHVYVCKREVLDLLQQKTKFDSLREDFFPWLCKLQYQKNRGTKYGAILDDPKSTVPISPDEGHEISSTARSLRVGLLIHRAEEGYCIRANNLPSYLEVNRHFVNDAFFTLPSDPQRRALIDAKASISSDSTIGDFTKVDERVTIKRSIIGKHCVIGKMVKIVGCILLDHCTIADGAKLEGSILGKNTTVGSKAELVRCVTQGGYEVKENGQLRPYTPYSYRNEKLDTSDWGAGTDEDEGVSEDSSEDV
ncbi:nucleotide-diphospho-sugar transferase [Scleroderma citrinum]